MTEISRPRIDSFGRHVSFHQGVGDSIDNCSAVVRRVPAENGDYEDVDSWVLSVSPTNRGGARERIERGRNVSYHMLWRSPGGDVFVPDYDFLHVRDAKTEAWRRVPLPALDTFVFTGISGTQDGTALLWGGQLGDQGEDERRLFTFDGRKLRELPDPGGSVFKAGGTRHDSFYVVGPEGLARWWNGSSWHSLELDTRASVSDLDVVSERELYLVTHGGELFHATEYGSARVLSSDQVFLTVARFRDHVYLGAAGDNGLYRVPVGSNQLERVGSYDARSLSRGPDRLLITCAEKLVDFDGEAFRERPIDGVYDVLSDTPPLDRDQPPADIPPAKSSDHR